MHTFGETGAGVPAFLAKLWRLVDDPKTDHLICWSKDGRSFILQNQAQFARELLPLNYKHNNMASFIRQLNMYGFHKIASIDNGGLKFDRDEMEFSHQYFKRNCPYLLEHIKRKIATSKSVDDKNALKPESVSKVLLDVKAMRGRQDSLDSRFSVMKQENEALWREIASLRQKHAKQQQIVNKLIHFLISIVQPSRNMTGVKRHMQLMINDNPQKRRNVSESESDCGPIIHELSEELLDEVANDEPQFLRDDSPERPQSSMSMMSNNYSNHSADDVLQQAGRHMQAQYQINGPIAEAIVTTPSSPNNANANQANIVYHITELPESDSGAYNFNEENHVATPMVRKHMERSQLMQHRNNKRRKQMPNAGVNAKQMRTGQPQESLLLMQHQQNQQQLQQQQQQQEQQEILMKQLEANVVTPTTSGNGIPNISAEPIKIKSEAQDTTDPMYFLNVFTENENNELLGEFNENSVASPNTNTANLMLASPCSNVTLTRTPTPSLVSVPSPNLYSPNTFGSDDINQDLFEDAELLAANCGQGNTNTTTTNDQLNDNNTSNNNKFDAKQQTTTQQQFGKQNVRNDTFGNYLSPNRNLNVATTSAGKKSISTSPPTIISTPPRTATNSDLLMPVANVMMSPNVLNNSEMQEKQQQQQQEQQNREFSSGENNDYKSSNNQPMLTVVAKYKNDPDFGHEDIMRLSTTDEVSDHLDNVQDELDTLKDLLRSDGYSLDTSTLIGNEGSVQPQGADLNAAPLEYLEKLFNDSDILNPFGLGNWQNELQNENKKGSELATYQQPVYDLSDIMDMDKSVNTSNATPSSSRGTPMRRSTLNTPRHE